VVLESNALPDWSNQYVMIGSDRFGVHLDFSTCHDSDLATIIRPTPLEWMRDSYY
jgi:hypothetical protein